MTFDEVIQILVDVFSIIGNRIVLMIGAMISLFFYVIGGIDEMLEVLFILMTVDYFTGVAKAFIIEKANSKQGFKGLLKKMVMIALIVLAHQIDLLFENKFALRTLTIGVLLSNEGLSILENASICGIPIPEKLKNMLEQYKESKNKK